MNISKQNRIDARTKFRKISCNHERRSAKLKYIYCLGNLDENCFVGGGGGGGGGKRKLSKAGRDKLLG